MLIVAAGTRRRTKAVADVNSSFYERLSHLQTRLDEVIKDSRETRYRQNSTSLTVVVFKGRV